MTVYVCPVCRYRSESAERPMCDRPRHGQVGPVPMLDREEHARGVRARLIASGSRRPDEVLAVPADELVDAVKGG